MEEKNQTGIIPEHETGKIIDAVSFVECENLDEARDYFKVVKARLLHVNGWNALTGSATADFQVVDPHGKEVDRPVMEGDYFKINVPGPGSFAGKGYDWVKVEAINVASEGDIESVGIRVRPSHNPTHTDDDDIAHFYSEESTSNFTVTREGRKITAGIYDRNTKYNKEGDFVDKARHFIVGLSAVTGFSKFQWQRLADGLLESDN